MIESQLPTALAERLATNREGRLLGAQWRDIVAEPLATLLLLLLPTVLLIGRLPPFARTWLVLGALVVLAVVSLLRGRRYARLPIYCARLYGGEKKLWWGSLVLYQANGQALRFRRWYTPLPPITADAPYIVYYLLDHDRPILLSIAPSHHPLAMPAQQFQKRGGRIVGEL